MNLIDSGYDIVVIKGEDKGKTIPLRYREIHMGRRSAGDSEPHWIYFAEPTVSRHHATLVWDDAHRHYTLYHKSRTNPTLVNGKPVQHAPLAHNDLVQVGLLIFKLDFVGTRQERAAATRTAPVAPPPDPKQQRQPELADSEEQSLVPSGLKLVATAGSDRGSVYLLDKPVLFIGRREGLDDLRGANGILLNDDGLPKEQVLLAWNAREKTYGIFQVETSTLPTRVLRRSGGEFQAIHLDSQMQTLLRVDDVISMGETALQVCLDTDLPDLGDDEPAPQSQEVVVRDHPRAFVDVGAARPAERMEEEAPRVSTVAPRATGWPPNAAAPPDMQETVIGLRRVLPDADSAEEEDDAGVAAPPVSYEPLAGIRFPTLDVDFVRNLPTRPPEQSGPFLDAGLRRAPAAGPGPTVRGLAPPPEPEMDPFASTSDTLRGLERASAFSFEPPEPEAHPDLAPLNEKPGLPGGYRPPELMEEDDEEAEPEFGETFSWRYRADYIIGFLEGRNKGQKVELLTKHLEDGRKIPVGSRGARVNEIEVDDPGVANSQATITYQGGRFTLLNEGARNSLFVNQLALGPNEEMLLKTGDRVSMGETVLIFLERSVVQMLSKFELIVVAGIPEDRGKSFDLLKEVVVVGRQKTCDIALADPEVSRRHVAITLRGGRFYLTHLSSSNPTFINGVSLPRGKDRILNEGDRIQLSDHTALVFKQRETAPAKRR